MTRLYLTRGNVDLIEASPSDVHVESTSIGEVYNIVIDIQLLGKIIWEWERANPSIPIASYVGRYSE